MKRTFFIIYIVNFLFIVSEISCSKESISSRKSTDGGPSTSTPFSLSLVANNWQPWEQQGFQNIFANILPAENVKNKSDVLIYLLKDNEEILINNAIFFMGNKLWATSNQSTITIYYLTSSQTLPFDYLKIKVVTK